MPFQILTCSVTCEEEKNHMSIDTWQIEITLTTTYVTLR